MHNHIYRLNGQKNAQNPGKYQRWNIPKATLDGFLGNPVNDAEFARAVALALSEQERSSAQDEKSL